MKAFLILTAAAAIAAPISLEPTSRIWVKGDSTVRAFVCNAAEITSVVNTTPGAELGSLVETAEVLIPVGKLDCGNGKMNEHMRKALKADAHPGIEFKLNSYKVVGEVAVVAGTLEIAGMTREIEIPGTVTRAGNNLVRFNGVKQVVMSEWGVKPPSLMMGTMKVKDAVTVGFDVTLKAN